MSEITFSISVIIPVYNGEQFLAQAVTHILQQNHHPLEIIVVDDGSTDETAIIAQQLKDKICYFYQDNKGPAAARNLGIKHAQGDLITFLDVDDLWSDNKLELQLNYLADYPDVDIIQGKIVKQIIEFDRSTIGKYKIIKAFQPYQYILLGSCIYRQSVFSEVGLFDETMRLGDDVDWFVRAWEQRINKTVADDVTLFYRQHNLNMTKNKSLVESGFVRVYKKHLDRIRKSGSSIEPLPIAFPSMVEYLGRETNQNTEIQ